MRRLALFVSAAAFICGSANAADPEQQLSITVYNSDLALVQDVRHLDVPAGRTRIEFKNVSASIRPETVTLSGKGLGIVEQNFDYDLLTPAKMMEKAVGKQIKIIRTIPGTGKETAETATVLSVNNGVILKIGNRIEALRDDGIPTRVVFDSIPENLRASPTLSVTVDAASAGARDLSLRYLTSGLKWNADYVASFDEDKGQLSLQGWITLKNTSGTSFTNAKVQVIAGDINIVGSDEQWWQRQRYQGSSSRGGGTNGPNADAIADYLLYSLPERVTIADQQTKQVGFIDLHGVKAARAYEFEANGFESDQNPEHVSSVLKFGNQDQALPEGIVRVYMRDQAGENKFVGESGLDHTPAGSDLDVKLGEAFDVTVQPTLVSSEVLSKTSNRYSMLYQLRNAGSKPVTVELHQGGLWHDGKVDSENLPSNRKDAQTLGWSVLVPANGETDLTFTVDTGG